MPDENEDLLAIGVGDEMDVVDVSIPDAGFDENPYVFGVKHYFFIHADFVALQFLGQVLSFLMFLKNASAWLLKNSLHLNVPPQIVFA